MLDTITVFCRLTRHETVDLTERDLDTVNLCSIMDMLNRLSKFRGYISNLSINGGYVDKSIVIRLQWN